MEIKKNQQTPFQRFLRYGLRYKKKFAMGIFVSLLLSLFNGISLTALKPIFDILGNKGKTQFQISYNDEEIRYLLGEQTDQRFKQLVEKNKDLRVYIKTHKLHLPDPDKEAAEAEPGLLARAAHKVALYKTGVNLYLMGYDPFDLIYTVCIAIIPVYLLRLLSGLGTVYFLSSGGLNIVRDIRADLYRKLVQLPMGNFVHEKSGVWMSRVINDVTLLSDIFAHDFRVSINNFFIVTTHVALLLLINYKLFLISVIGVPLLLWPVNHFARKIKNITSNEQSRLADLNGHMQEVIGGIRVIRAFGMENYELGRFTAINDRLTRDSFKYRYNHVIGPSMVEFVSSLIVIGLMIYGANQIMNEHYTSGSFFMFLFTLLMILSPIKQLATWYNILHRIAGAGERVFELIDTPPEPGREGGVEYTKPLQKGITFNNICFRYEGSEHEVLKGIKLKVGAGKTVALVGHSGAGKSTFVDLISRFYEPTSGEILFDGVDIRNYKLDDLRGKIGIVTQEIFLFNDTVLRNIAFGREDVTREDIEHAARMAFADEFIQKLPNGYDSIIGERGTMLSGGQRQRLSIARALLKNPEILILDEATSALDTRSERLVQKALERLMQDRTTFVIAHRLSTVYQADMILVFHEGKIKEKGTHESLLKKGGLYKKYYEMQFHESEL